MEPIITIIPEEVVSNTLIETSDNSGVSTVQFHNFEDDADLSLEQELYDWKFATVDCFKDEFEDEAEVGHKVIVANGQSAECLQIMECQED